MTLPRWLVLAWVAGTLACAGSLGAATRSGALVLPLLERIGLSAEGATVLHVALRKAGHVAAYAAFALLARWAQADRAGRGARALLAAFALALADEAVQAWSVSRGGSAADVLLDTAAAAAALALAARSGRRGRRVTAAGA